MKSGLPPDAASVPGIGGDSSAVAAMEQGRVDAAVMVSSYPAAVLYTTREWLDDNGDNARKLASAIVKTLQWIEQHSTEEIAKVKEAYSRDGVMHADGAEAVRAVLAQFIPEVQQADIELAKTYSNDYLPGKAK